jgi:fumarate hydratase class II
MNMNEVLANRASELMGGRRGEGRLVHPNDDVNRGQSSNDVFPTAMHVAAVVAIRRHLLPALAALRATLAVKSAAFADIVKIGRTHLQDATPLTLGQEFSGYVSQLDHAIAHIEAALPHLSELALGGTAVGTGLNTHPRFGSLTAAEISRLTGMAFVTAPNKFEALATHDAMVHAHGAIKGLAVALTKIANDVRLLASGPRCGIGEIGIPENEPGSSIMPGKVNPIQVEALTMAACRMGNDVATPPGLAGPPQLNVCKPVIAFLACVMADGARFDEHCAASARPRAHRAAPARLAHARDRAAPKIGYDKAAEIAKKAHHEGRADCAKRLSPGLVTPAQYDDGCGGEDDRLVKAVQLSNAWEWLLARSWVVDAGVSGFGSSIGCRMSGGPGSGIGSGVWGRLGGWEERLFSIMSSVRGCVSSRR